MCWMWQQGSGWSYPHVIPAMLDGCRGNSNPGLSCHHHCLAKTDLPDVAVASFIKIDCTKTKFIMVMGFEASNDAGIKGLDKWGEIWFKEDDLNVLGSEWNPVTQDIVYKKANVLLLNAHLDIEYLDPSVHFTCQTQCGRELLWGPYPSNSSPVIQAFLLL